MLAEMGLEYPEAVKDSIPDIVPFCDSSEPLLRERALNALGRIGRAEYQLTSVQDIVFPQLGV